MRFTEEQIREKLHHPEREVRSLALQYFGNSFSRNPAIMPEVIEVLEQFWPQSAFGFIDSMSLLVQTAPTVDWAVKLASDPLKPNGQYRYLLGDLLCKADPFLVMPHLERILAPYVLESDHADRLQFRLGLLATPSDELWKQLESLHDDNDGEIDQDVPVMEAEELAAALARDVSQAGRMLETLGQGIDRNGETSHSWLDVYLIQMAGHMRYEPAIPLIIKKFFPNDDLECEHFEKSLTQIGTDNVIRALRDEYPQATENFRMCAARIFKDIHSDLAVSAGLELMRLEIDHDLRIDIATSLVGQFSTECFDAAQDVLLREAPYVITLKSDLIQASRFMDYKVDLAEQWQQEILEGDIDEPELGTNPFGPGFIGDDEDFDENGELYEDDEFDDDDEFDGELPTPPPPPKIKIGRNDPCPCGSGKKFKKCCYGKLASNEDTDDDPISLDDPPPVKDPRKFPIGTVALYGPDDKTTTKIVAGVIKEEGANAIVERWVGRNVKNNPKVRRQIEEFMKLHGVKSMVATETNFGCPHEEGIDFPEGKDCPFCPYWKGKQGTNRQN